MQPFAPELAPLAATTAVPALAEANSDSRSPAVTAEFERMNPCPSTGNTHGACPGWIKDHVIPLCEGGADAVSSLQRQTVDGAKAKDKWECK